MSIVRKALIASVLLGCIQSALAREVPEEFTLPLYKAVAKECSAKDPVNATHYKAGLAIMMKRHPELAKMKVSEKDYPNFAQRLKEEVATMNDKALLRECMTLYDLAGEEMRAAPKEPPPHIGSETAKLPK